MVTVAQAAENYLDWFRVHRRSVAETEAVINTHILPWFAHREVESLTTKELKQWRDGLAATPRRKKGRKGAVLCEPPKTPDERRARKNTTNRILTVFKAILNKAFEEDDCSSGVAQGEAVQERRLARHPVSHRGRVRAPDRRVP